MRARYPGDLLVASTSIFGLALLVLNDHVLKATFHNALTGKLSDVGGLLVLPALLTSLIELGRRAVTSNSWPISLRTFTVIVLVIAISFVLMKAWTPAGCVYTWLNSVIEWPALAVKSVINGKSPLTWPRSTITHDPTDIAVLPVLVIAWLSGRARIRRPLSTE